nr:GGDEF domain-containing phosphodiesterase [Pseudenhygromyxa sp. WMMC2535]
MLAIVKAHAEQRSALRRRAQEVGAIDCLLYGELTPALLEAVIVHARNHIHQSARLAELRDRFSLAIRGARDGMWEWDLVRSRVFYSQRWRELMGIGSGPVEPTIESWLSLVHPQDVDDLRGNLENHIKGLLPVHEHEHRVRDSEGDWRWVLSRGVVHRDIDGRAMRMAGSLTDLTPYRQRELNIRERSREDKLTKLPDRPVLFERLARAVELARAHEDFEFVVMLVEVDRMTQLRDSYGVVEADAAFATIAARLREALGSECALFRFEGDKLAILLEDVDHPGVGTHVADQIHRVVADPFEVAGALSFTTVSIGMTSSAHDYAKVEEVISDVSAATDTARERGRNRHEIFDTSMRIEARTLLALEMSLRQAIDEGELRLHYQPIYTIAAGRTPEESRWVIAGFEALMRWEHPERGLVSPGEFIPIAEDTGLIIPMGRWAIRQAARTLHGWHEEFGRTNLSLSVNLSAKQVDDPLLLETIDTILAETSLDPACFKLELTESVMMDRVDEVTELLQQIRSRGVEIWIDDFGTGYSSLSYLQRFPVDGLKIDRSFVMQLDGSERSEAMVRTIIALAQGLGLHVIAEGIEERFQAEQLGRLGCERFQGFMLGKPMPESRIRELLASLD